MKYKIYKLIYKGEIVYIGQTQRTFQERKKSKYNSNEKLKAIQKDCIYELIEETEDKSKERFWISFYKNQGCNLLNVRSGDGLDYDQYKKSYKKEWDIKNKEKIKMYHQERYEKLKS
jgi:hypothetical protein